VSGAKISSISLDSPASTVDLLVGDELVSVNGREPSDIIEYQQLIDGDVVTLVVRREGEELARKVTITKAEGQPLGLGIDSAVFDRIRTCDNHCSFCFIYQLPKGMRRSLYVKQAERARQLLTEAGVPAEVAADVATWVSKTGLKTNKGTQALEDAAVLVFLESEIEAFAAQHAEYPREKFVDILKKTWRKMSPRAQELALGLDLPEAIAGLVREALA